jgi:cytochrome c oxidase cbb3-type subunit I/II
METAPESWHRKTFEHRSALFAVVTTCTILIGGLAEIVPMFTVDAGPERLEGINPYSPLELAGRDIYVREGCYNCHSQMIRPFRSETLRYGEWSRAGEYIYDRPFQLGSRRIGPDLQREGGKKSDDWHFKHMKDPREVTKGSIMPPYPWLYSQSYDVADITASMKALKSLGTPYTDDDIANAGTSVSTQAGQIVSDLASKNLTIEPDKEIVALIGYLQRLGKDGSAVLAKEGGK